MEILKNKPKSIVGKIEESKTKTSNFKRAGKTTIGIFPTRNNVIVKNTFRVLAPVINKTEDIFEKGSVELEVVAYGCETEEIEIGDKVLITYHASVERIDIPGNDLNVGNMQKLILKQLSGDFAKLSKAEVDMEEFFNIPYFSITSIYKTDGIKNEVSLLHAMTGNV